MLSLKTLDLKKIKAETLIVPVVEDVMCHKDSVLEKVIETAKSLPEFKGEAADELVLYDPDGIGVKRVVLMGLGKMEKITTESIRKLSGKAVKWCIQKRLESISFAVPYIDKKELTDDQVIWAMAEGAVLANDIFDKYKKEKKYKPLGDIDLLTVSANVKKFKALKERTEAVCSATLTARNWVTMPSNDKRPEDLAKMFEAEARQAGLKTQVLDEKKMSELKMGAMLAVAAGSQSKPRLLIMEYAPAKAKKTIVLVGKGVTFDSGGINLKPSTGIAEMKLDMAGAAAVAATMIALPKIKPNLHIVGLMPIVENMPSGQATRPGDIATGFSGKTIEIDNTDAEGRLILSDAMSYAQIKYKPQVMIDLATLTGACVVALGDKIAGFFSSDEYLADIISKAGEKTHERCWPLPLPEDYKELLKSEIADIRNVSDTRYGGAITAALFLSEFVEDTKWAHIDIAGPAFSKKGNAYCNSGGTGFGVRLMCEVLSQLFQQ